MEPHMGLHFFYMAIYQYEQNREIYREEVTTMGEIVVIPVLEGTEIICE
jgi:hypothetical protein